MKSQFSKIIRPLIYALLLAIGVQMGIYIANSSSGKVSIFEQAEYDKIDDILRFVELKYVDSVERNEIVEGVIDELLDDLDPHSFYIPARDLGEVNEGLSGNFEGIGIEFFIVEDTITVVSPIAGGPAESLGILSGDQIVKIEDSLVAGVGFTNQDVVKKLRGEKGSMVKVSIRRSQDDELLDFEIIRDKIPLYSVDIGHMIDNEIGYIKINRFSKTTTQEFYEKLNILVNSGMQKLIIDLRQNPGGYLESATKIADELLAGHKEVVYTEGKAYDKRSYSTNKPGLFEEGKLAILIDQGSASASEILAGAVQDWDRGSIIGRRSFGKGLVQEQYDLRDGSALRLTIARYYTPSGRCIQKPYDKGEQAYNEEIVSRYENGEFHDADSNTVVDSAVHYTLIEKRPVYAGGGISPDIFVGIDTSLNYNLLARIRAKIPEFIYNHFSSKSEYYQQKYPDFDGFKSTFTVSNQLYSEFIEELEKAKIDTKSEDFQALDERTKTLLKAYIARQLWRNDGYYPIINEMDNTVTTAIDWLRNGETLTSRD